jgi:superfamily I DNA/RNA helicase
VRDEIKKLVAVLRLATNPDSYEFFYRALELYMKAGDLARFKQAQAHSGSASALVFLDHLLVSRKSKAYVAGETPPILPRNQAPLRRFVASVRSASLLLADDDSTLEKVLDCVCGDFEVQEGPTKRPRDECSATDEELKLRRTESVAVDDDDGDVADAVSGSIRGFFAEALSVACQASLVNSEEGLATPQAKVSLLHLVLDDMLNVTTTDNYGYQLSAREKARQAVTISTVHAAKGLEWPIVIVYECNIGHFPPSAPKDRRSVEISFRTEEQRVFYVAATRARDELYFLGHQMDEITPYIKLIDKNLLSYELIIPD